jgi:nicotinamide-nucleotide amidase
VTQTRTPNGTEIDTPAAAVASTDELDELDDLQIAERIAGLLEGRALATAESCTAGRVAEVFASVTKAQEFFRGGLVSYQVPIKRSLLGVTSASVLTPEAAEQMAAGVCTLLDAQVAVATTGVAGDSPEDGVLPGTVYIATCVSGRVHAREHHFGGEPPDVCDDARRQALIDLLRDLEG